MGNVGQGGPPTNSLSTTGEHGISGHRRRNQVLDIGTGATSAFSLLGGKYAVVWTGSGGTLALQALTVTAQPLCRLAVELPQSA